MPRKPAKPCLYPHCPALTHNHTGYCEKHQPAPNTYRKPDYRPSIYTRYGPEWKRIRARVLRENGIPKNQWHLYNVDHRPTYNPAVEPDHNKYALVPMLKSDHSKKTASQDGGFGNKKRGGGGSQPLRRTAETRVDQLSICDVSKGDRG